MQLELISFKICPFVQRSVITLMLKDVPFDTTFIELSDPPEWFGELSPLGKVPVLKVDGHVLFESAVINEYLDETHGDPLMPRDPLVRAEHRGWTELGSNAIFAMYQAITAKEEDAYQAKRKELARLLGHLDRKRAAGGGEGPYFAGEHFSLVDTAFAPLFQRLRYLERFEPIFDWSTCPSVSAWAERLEVHPVVESSLPDDFGTRFRQSLKNAGGYYARFIDDAG